jgi:hypothetical protein
MIVALATTKVEIFANKGLWEMMHESRTDWAMLLGRRRKGIPDDKARPRSIQDDRVVSSGRSTAF